jgi:hypothetical protein
MKRLLRRSALLAVLPLILTSRTNLSAPGGGDARSPEDIMVRAIRRAKWVGEQKPDLKYSYSQFQVMEQLGDGNAVKERAETTYEAVVIDGRRFFRLLAKNGKPLSGEELQEEKEREATFRQQPAKRPVASITDEEDVELDEALVNRFKFTLEGKETINGRSVFALSFEPKSDTLPAPKRIDRAINNLAGRVWVDEQEYELVKVDARLLKPVGFGWGLLANIDQANLRIEQVRLDDGTWMPASIEVYLKGRKLFTPMHQREKNTMNNFKKVG